MLYVSSSLAVFSFEKFEKAKAVTLYRNTFAYEPQEKIAFSQYARAPTAVHVGKGGFYVTSFRPVNTIKYTLIPVWVYYPKHVDELKNVLKNKPLSGTLARWINENIHDLPRALYEITRQTPKVHFKVASFNVLTHEELEKIQVSFRVQNLRGNVYTVWSRESEPHALLGTTKDLEIDSYFEPFDWTANNFVRPFALFKSIPVIEKALSELFLVRYSQQRVDELKTSVIQHL